MNVAPTSKETKAQVPSGNAIRLKLARQLHLYLGTLFAPSIIFFAFTGSLQLFGLHEGQPWRSVSTAGMGAKARVDSQGSDRV
jgi:hypothetical protein